MSERAPTRRAIILGAAGLSVGALTPARAEGGTDLTKLYWNEAESKVIWGRVGGASYAIFDTVPMVFSGKPRRAAVVPLSPQNVKDALDALGAASQFFRSKGMGPPKLPILNGRFHVFFIDDMGNINGATGGGVGSTFVLGTEYLLASPGNHLMINAHNFQNPDADHLWAPRITLAHELLHAIDDYILPGGSWQNIGGWWTEGNVEATAQYAFQSLGYDPLPLLSQGGWSHAQHIGMRPYDYPLTLKGVPGRRPNWVTDGTDLGDKEREAADSFWAYNATYFTSSFWRFLLKEEAPTMGPSRSGVPASGNFELIAPLRLYVANDADRKAVAGNPHMDAGVPALDRFLRGVHPTWGATGLHRAYPAFIAHFVEWPDQVIKKRNGLLAHSKWLDTMFMDGAPKRELTADKDITIDLEILPLAAKALRFEVPAVGLIPAYPMITITVSVLDGSGQDSPIDNVHVGLRGQCLGNGLSQGARRTSGRLRRWPNIKATPLKRKTVNDETVMTFINVAPDAAKTRPIKVRVNISLQVASSTGQCSFHPKPIETEDGKPEQPPPSIAPKGEDVVPILPVERGVDGSRVVLVKDADLVRMINAIGDPNVMMSVPRESDEPWEPSQIAQQTTALNAKMTAGPLPPRVELELPRIEPGYLGPVTGAKVAAEWHEPRYARFARYGLSERVRIETDAVQVQIVSATEGTLLGRFSADFDRGSQNVEAIFRGRIEGRFSLGIAKDEAETDDALPKDPAAVLPTDFFIGAARGGISREDLIEAIREASGAMADGGGGGGGPAAPTGSGMSGVLEPAGDCPGGASRADFDAYFEAQYGALPGLTTAERARMKTALLENWEFTKLYVCEWKAGR